VFVYCKIQLELTYRYFLDVRFSLDFLHNAVRILMYRTLCTNCDSKFIEMFN